MCLAIPMILTEKGELEGLAELDGVRRRIGLMLCPEAEEGDFVLVHAGYAIGVVDEVEARRTLALIDEAMRREDAELAGAPDGIDVEVAP